MPMNPAFAALLADMQVHDVSPVMSSDMPQSFLHGALEINPVMRHATDGAATNSLTMSEHTGTHVDAPFHFDPQGRTMDQVPVESLLLRPFKKFDLTAHEYAPGDLIAPEALRAAADAAGFALDPGDIAIVETGWDRHRPGGSVDHEPGWWGANQPGFALETCELLAGAGIVAVASDTSACDVAIRDGEILSGHGHATAFLPRGILIIEGLTGLAGVPCTGLFLALPLKIEGGTGSPLRVVLLTDRRSESVGS
jgi:arylformamidase